MFLQEDFATVKIHNKNNTIKTQIMQLEVNDKFRNQFNTCLSAKCHGSGAMSRSVSE